MRVVVPFQFVVTMASQNLTVPQNDTIIPAWQNTTRPVIITPDIFGGVFSNSTAASADDISESSPLRGADLVWEKVI